MRHGFVDAFGHFILCQVGNGAVQRRGADKGVNARATGVFDGFPAAIDIAEICACQAANDRGFGVLSDFADGGKVAFRRNWETGLDNINAHFVQQAGDFQFFVMSHGCAGALFAVTQSCVEDQHAVFVVGHGLVSFVRQVRPGIAACFKLADWVGRG